MFKTGKGNIEISTKPGTNRVSNNHTEELLFTDLDLKKRGCSRYTILDLVFKILFRTSAKGHVLDDSYLITNYIRS